MADNEIMIEIYGTSPYVELDVDQSSIDLEQGEPSVIIAALPIKGDTGATGAASWNPSDVVTEIMDFTLQDGTRDTFPLAHEAYASTVEVYRNGLMEFDGIGYGISSPTTVTHVTFTTAPLSSDVISVRYLKVH